MNNIGLIAWGLSGICALIVAALWLDTGRRDYNHATRDDYADQAIDIADQAHDQDFDLWTSEFWNDMNTKETES